MKTSGYFLRLVLIVQLSCTFIQAQNPVQPPGSGTEQDPYQVATLDHLAWMCTNPQSWDKNYIQTADIDASATKYWDGLAGWIPAGNGIVKFTGSYDGQGKTISGLHIMRDTFTGVGFFGCTSHAQINYLGIINAKISGGERVGGLIGANDESQVTNCYFNGDVDGAYEVGGLIGIISGSNAIIADCYVTGSAIASADTVGGLVAKINDGASVATSYSAAIVSGSASRGGLVGYNTTGIVSESFWDIGVSGQTHSAGGTGKSTSEMKMISTYTSAGWDFNFTWGMSALANDGYPYLQYNIPGFIEYTWNGSIDNDWNTAENWDQEELPSLRDHVILPSGLTNYPVVQTGDTASCDLLDISEGATLTIASGASIITGEEIINDGTVNIERNINDGQWHLISIPVNEATAGIFLGDYLQNYNEVSDTWQEIIDPATQLYPGQGYALWGVAKSTTYVFSGNPNTGYVSQDFTFNPAGNPDHYGFNLMGNPYPSYIDWSLLNETYGAVYYLDGENYISWNGVGAGSQYVAPMQGFMIAPGFDGTLELDNSVRTNDGSTAYYKKSGIGDNTLVLTVDKILHKDKLYVVFNDEATDGFDLPWDAFKIITPSIDYPQLYSSSGDARFSIDQRPACEQITLGFVCGESGIYRISVEESTLLGSLILEDKKTGIIHDLNTGAYEYYYNKSESDRKFILHFAPSAIHPEIVENPIKVYSSGKQLFVKSNRIQSEIKVSIFDMTGSLLKQENCRNTLAAVIDLPFSCGIYVTTVISEKSVISKQFFIE